MQVVEGLDAWSGLEALRPVLWTFLVRRCRDENEAEDIIQETFVRAARYRRSLMQPARFRAWVLRIASNVLRDQRRRSFRQPAMSVDEELLDQIEGGEPPPDTAGPCEDLWIDLAGDLIDGETALGHLRFAYWDLRPRDRRVLASFYGGSQSCAATASECGISPALVKVRLFRARRRLERGVRVRVVEALTNRLVTV